MSIVHRTQIYLPHEQTERLDEGAGAEGVSRSVLIRRAADLYLAREGLDGAEWQARWRAAAQGTAGIAPYLPDGANHVEHLREIDAGRVQELDRRRLSSTPVCRSTMRAHTPARSPAEPWTTVVT